METREKRHIAILGSTGSIGTQALEVIRNHKDKFEVEVLTAQNNADLLISQAVEFVPNVVVIGNETLYDYVKSALGSFPIKVYTGDKALASVTTMEHIDMVLTAMVGSAGLLPTINAILAGKTIALANKETLVVAGEFHNPIEKLILTASGGPFRGKDKSFLRSVTKAQALKHPNWDMGAKITIDSASMMNKGLEVIEAKWLFQVRPEQIEVVVHPQSIIHSLVQFADGSIKAQLGLPDMKLPIQYALGYPSRLASDFPRFDFLQYPQLTFEKPDIDTFKNLQLAYGAMERGGNIPCTMNAANEIAVAAFLREEIGFLQISDIIEHCMDMITYIKHPSIEDLLASDTRARELATAYCIK